MTQARDVFDLDILQRGGFAQGDQLRRSAQKCSSALRNLDGLSFDDFSGQVLEFLDEEYRREFASPDVWHSMVSQLRSLLNPL